MYGNARSRVWVGNAYSEEFEVKVGVHQGSVLSPLLFIIVLEALSRSFRTGCPFELLYADDLAIIAKTKEELLVKLAEWKKQMEAKGLRVNMKKTKIMVSGPNLNTLKDSGRYPCAVCRSGVGKNSILCHGCKLWVHKKCSHIEGRLTDDPTFRCSRCRGTAQPIDSRPFQTMALEGRKLEVVDSFCYLGDTVSAGGGCCRSITNRTRVAWGKFHDLLPILKCRSISLPTRGRLYSTCVRSAMLHATECMGLTVKDTCKLQKTDRAMIRWICGVKLKDRVRSDILLDRLKIPDITETCRANRLRWFGHVQRNTGWTKRCTEMVVDGKTRLGGQKKRWRTLINEDLKLMSIPVEMTKERKEWRRAIHKRVRITSQLQPNQIGNKVIG